MNNKYDLILNFFPKKEIFNQGKKKKEHDNHHVIFCEIYPMRVLYNKNHAPTFTPSKHL